MFETLLTELPRLIETYGYGLVALMIALESLGLPLPGEATLITAAVYAGATQRLSLALIIMAAVAGAVIGDNLGFWLGGDSPPFSK